jgi:hypothetical protein
MAGTATSTKFEGILWTGPSMARPKKVRLVCLTCHHRLIQSCYAKTWHSRTLANGLKLQAPRLRCLFVPSVGRSPFAERQYKMTAVGLRPYVYFVPDLSAMLPSRLSLRPGRARESKSKMKEQSCQVA